MLPITFDHDELERLCRHWKVAELSLFGSVLRNDFRPDSDVDVLVRFEPDAPWSLWDLVDMKADFERFFGREVDIVEEEGLRNPFRRHEIMRTRRQVYATPRADHIA